MGAAISAAIGAIIAACETAGIVATTEVAIGTAAGEAIELVALEAAAAGEAAAEGAIIAETFIDVSGGGEVFFAASGLEEVAGSGVASLELDSAEIITHTSLTNFGTAVLAGTGVAVVGIGVGLGLTTGLPVNSPVYPQDNIVNPLGNITPLLDRLTGQHIIHRLRKKKGKKRKCPNGRSKDGVCRRRAKSSKRKVRVHSRKSSKQTMLSTRKKRVLDRKRQNSVRASNATAKTRRISRKKRPVRK